MQNTENQSPDGLNDASGPPPLSGEGEQKTGTTAVTLESLADIVERHANQCFDDAKMNGSPWCEVFHGVGVTFVGLAKALRAESEKLSR